MTLDEFWGHIRATRRVDSRAHNKRLIARLTKLPVKDILDFHRWWHVALAEAKFWDLWGAAYLINGGCSNDGFEYFRDWLILQGQKVFQAAIANPDSLADVVDPDEEVECECYPSRDAWFDATKTSKDNAGYTKWQDAVAATSWPKLREMGEQWNFGDDAQVRKRFPRLAKMYLDRG